MKKIYKSIASAIKFSFSVIIVFLLSESCTIRREYIVPVAQIISPTDVNGLTRILVYYQGGINTTPPTTVRRVNGAPPTPSPAGTGVPIISNLSGRFTSSNGSTAILSFNYRNANNGLAGIYVQVAGADSYADVPYVTNASSGSGNLQLNVSIPANVGGGEFRVSLCVYDAAGKISNVLSTTIQVLRLGTGALQISLSWGTATDQDLYVTDPFGKVIYYGSRTSSSGGFLDRDDQDGFGPENVYWENAPDGKYIVEVQDYETTSTPNPFVITVTSPNRSKRFSGETRQGNQVKVLEIVKNGSSYTF
jgi:hypothetical protein